MTTQSEPLFGGCFWITGTSTKGVGKNKQAYHTFCNKLRQEGSVYCPKHQLFHEDDQKEPERRAAQRKAIREYRQAEQETLALSPLRAHNPEFQNKTANQYVEAEEK